jgi:tRNA modification GTPase
LFDTAGIRIAEDEIEKEGVIRTREVIKNADIVLLINDVQHPESDILSKEVSILNPDKIIKVLNKIDLGFDNKIDETFYVSALSGEGMNKLLNKLKELSLENNIYSEKSAIVSNARHFNCLKKASESLNNAVKSINENLSGEFISIDLRNAASNLGEIIGEITSDDILNNIFTKFCIGK